MWSAVASAAFVWAIRLLLIAPLAIAARGGIQPVWFGVINLFTGMVLGAATINHAPRKAASAAISKLDHHTRKVLAVLSSIFVIGGLLQLFRIPTLPREVWLVLDAVAVIAYVSALVRDDSESRWARRHLRAATCDRCGVPLLNEEAKNFCRPCNTAIVAAYPPEWRDSVNAYRE